jgi:hypothetical protein
MPAGVSWPKYLMFFAASMTSMMLGAQTVHVYYRPLDDLNQLVEQELERFNKEKAQNHHTH